MTLSLLSRTAQANVIELGGPGSGRRPGGTSSTVAPLEDFHGFMGASLMHLPDVEKQEAWGHAVGAIADKHGVSDQVAHNYLRSTYGRHFGDSVSESASPYNHSVGAANTPASVGAIKTAITAKVGSIGRKEIKRVANQTKQGAFDD